MLLVIDVGNTNIVLGLYDKETLTHNWRVSTDKDKTSDEYGMLFTQLFNHDRIDMDRIESIIISSVVPNLMHTLPSACRRYFNREPMVVELGIKTGMPIRYDNPKEVGADRIVNAVAGYEKYGGPLLIVDIGTAVTLDVISEKGEYLGGAIAPGIGIASEALFLRAAKLPRVELTEPKRAIGKTTVESMQSGIVYGYIGLIDHIIENILKELDKSVDEVKIVGTGGYSGLIVRNSKYIQQVDKLITLEGLRMIYERNKG